jgi:hypothetical protein
MSAVLEYANWKNSILGSIMQGQLTYLSVILTIVVWSEIAEKSS